MKSGIRICGGTLKGQLIPSPVIPGVRPTAERMRRSFFDRIGDNICDVNFVDGFAGSGIMGLEALSRGAGFSIFLESEKQACVQLINNLKHFNLESRSFVFKGDIKANILEALKNDLQKTIIYFDPPYGIPSLKDVFEQICSKEVQDKIEFIAVEHHHKSQLLKNIKGWKKSFNVRYGETSFTYLTPDLQDSNNEVNK